MLYLSGHVYCERHPMVGAMLSPDIGNRTPPDTWWAFDNACFARHGEFDWARWERTLRRRLEVSPDRCLFVVAPDVPFDADATLRRFEQYRVGLRQLGVPIALVTQDGMGVEDVPWPDIDALMVGGTTRWKTGQESAALVTEAKRRGLWVHMGRVNSLRRLRAAQTMGCDSVDGTYLAFGPNKNWLRLKGWLEVIACEQTMVL